MFDALYEHMTAYIALSEKEREIIRTLFLPRAYRKHQYILQEGEVCRYESFIVSGLTRIYEVDEKGQEYILQFGVEGSWIGDMYSFLSGMPSQFCIDCLEDTQVLQISKQHKQLLFTSIPKLEKYFRILVQNAYVSTLKRISSNLSKPAWERYQEFLQRNARIDQRVTDRQIASYLGITPQSLSRIRRQCMSQKV